MHNVVRAVVIIGVIFCLSISSKAQSPTPSPVVATTASADKPSTEPETKTAPAPAPDFWHQETMTGDWGGKFAEVKALSDVQPWRLAVVLEVPKLLVKGGAGVAVGAAPVRFRITGTIEKPIVREIRDK